MNPTLDKWARLNFLIILVFLQLTVYLTVIFDIPIARQVLGFTYFNLLPGFIILKLLKLDDDLDITETTLLTVGLSIVFLMFAGLFVNEFGVFFDVKKPLSLTPLIIILNSFILLGGVLVYLKSECVKNFLASNFRIPLSALFFMILPVSAVLGAILANVYSSNLILLIIILLTAILFAVVILSERFLPTRFYPFAVFCFALSLLFQTSLVSKYLYTGDIHMEYFVFRITENSARWESVFTVPMDIVYGRLNSMLSITILPTIYSVTLNMDASLVLKLLYPFIFSCVPVGLYKLWQKEVGAKKAFIAAFLFMSFNTFYTEMLGLNRQMIAELFFVLLLLVIFNKDMKSFNRMVCFMIFSFALIVSHYSLAEIFLVFISTFFILSIIFKHQNKNVAASMIIFFLVSMFAWYIYTSSSAVFESLLTFGDYVLRQLVDFFNPTSRGPYVLRGLGLEAPPSIWNAIGRAFAYITEALIAIGFVGILLKRVKRGFSRYYFMLSLIAMIVLFALILVPGLASTINMTRFYHILLFLLAPFCVIGAEVILSSVSKQRTALYSSILLLFVLVPYFLFQTGFVYEVAGVESWSVPLSKYRMDNQILMCTFAYINGWKTSGALWLNGHVDVQTARIYKDWSAHELVSYGMLPYAQFLSNTTVVPPAGIVYLSYLNVIDGLVVTLDGRIFNSTELLFITNVNLVYSNGGCQVYVVPEG